MALGPVPESVVSETAAAAAVGAGRRWGRGTGCQGGMIRPGARKAVIVSIGSLTSSTLPQKQLGWHRVQPGFSRTSKKVITSTTNPISGLVRGPPG